MSSTDPAAPFAAALAALDLPASVTWSVEVDAGRKRSVGVNVEPEGRVVFVVPGSWATQKKAERVEERVEKFTESVLAAAPQAAVNARTRIAAGELLAPGAPGWTRQFDLIIGQSSGGKDSEVALLEALKAIRADGGMDLVAWLHIWLNNRDPLDRESDGERVEWQQVPALAAEQAARCGLPLGAGEGWGVWDAQETGAPVDRKAWAGQLHFARRRYDGDLLDDVATRRKRDGTLRGWPTMWTRYCTSDWKTAVGRDFIAFLCEQIRREQGLTRPVRVLQIMGFRAEESDDRAARSAHGLNYRASAPTRRLVWEWLPIHDLSKVDVWNKIRESGLPYHPVYDEGLSRLSCRGCVLSGAPDLSIMRRLSPTTAAAIEQIEADQNDPFQYKRPLSSISTQPGRAGFAVRWANCPTCSVRVLARDWETQRFCPAHAATGPWTRSDETDSTGGCGQPPADSPWRAALASGR